MVNSTTPENKHKTLKFFLSAIGLLLCFVLIFSCFSRLLVHPEDDRSYSMIKGFYEEEKGSLDAVFIGSSTSYADWNQLVAWHEYGITAYTFTSPAQPLFAAEYMCKEARKTQPDALYIFNLMTMVEYFEKDQFFGFHALIDYMPLSLNRLQLSKALCDNMGYDYSENLEYFIPLVRYHDQWENFDGAQFHKKADGVKGTAHYGKFLRDTKDLNGTFYSTDKTLPFKKDTKVIEKCVNSLLDYLKKENVNALFITAPTTGKDEKIYQYINTAEEMVKKAGFPVLDFQNQSFLENEMGIDVRRDFYNTSHFNIHGNLKSTKYLSEYLIKNYGFKNKRNDKSYKAGKSWDEAYEKYINYLLPFTLEPEYTLKTEKGFFCPKIYSQTAPDGSVTLSWGKAEGADGYAVYRKDGDKVPYQKIAEGEMASCSYTEKPEKGKTYTYLVIAYKGEGENRTWSSYYSYGASVKL